MENEKRLDIVVNCAGFSMAAPVEYVKSEDYRYLFDVNFFGAIELIKAVVPNMKPRGRQDYPHKLPLGGVTLIPYDPYYSASKAALNILAQRRCLSAREAKHLYNLGYAGRNKDGFFVQAQDL